MAKAFSGVTRRNGSVLPPSLSFFIINRKRHEDGNHRNPDERDFVGGSHRRLPNDGSQTAHNARESDRESLRTTSIRTSGCGSKVAPKKTSSLLWLIVRNIPRNSFR